MREPFTHRYEELQLFFIRLRPPLIVAAVFLTLCRSLSTMCWISFLYSFACISYPASTTHSHTHTNTFICAVTHKHNHRRGVLFCAIFFSSHSCALLSSKTYFFPKRIIEINYFTFSQNKISCYNTAHPI